MSCRGKFLSSRQRGILRRLIGSQVATHLQDLQHFVRLLLGHDGIVVEAAQLPLKPKGVDVSRMQILLLRTHQLARRHQLQTNPRKRYRAARAAGRRASCRGASTGGLSLPRQRSRGPAGATVRLPELLILWTSILAAVSQQLRGSSPPTNHLSSIHRRRGSSTPLQMTPKPCLTCSSVTHVGWEGATDNGFIPLHVVIGSLVTHFAVDVLVALLPKEERQ